MKTKIILIMSVFFLTLVSCKENNQDVPLPVDDSPVFMDISSYHSPAKNLKSSPTGDVKTDNIAVLKAEYLTVAESGEIGRTVYFMNVGNKQLGADFVTDLSLDGTTDVSYYIDENRPSSDQPAAISTGAIQRAMETWNGITCSDLGMYQVPYSNELLTGYIAYIFGYSGSPEYISDVTFCGWMPAGFFDKLATGGSSYILGVTFTLIFVDEEGIPSDYDNNNKSDVAWREIYFNDNFLWNDGATYDIETIALHEAGHGLSQAHFGKAFRDAGAGYLHFSPRAVMNAAYSGIQTEITKTDNAGHCSIWANWPTH